MIFTLVDELRDVYASRIRAGALAEAAVIDRAIGALEAYREETNKVPMGWITAEAFASLKRHSFAENLNITPQQSAEYSVPLFVGPEEKAAEWTAVRVRQPPPHARYKVNRNGEIMVATPCYGMHPSWWVPFDGEREDEPIVMMPNDEWQTLEKKKPSDAVRYQALREYLRVVRLEPGEQTCWLEIDCVPFMSTKNGPTDLNELVDKLVAMQAQRDEVNRHG